jgi:hypothetical protein
MGGRSAIDTPKKPHIAIIAETQGRQHDLREYRAAGNFASARLG